jgi:hypothetical protein
MVPAERPFLFARSLRARMMAACVIDEVIMVVHGRYCAFWNAERLSALDDMVNAVLWGSALGEVWGSALGRRTGECTGANSLGSVVLGP